MPRGELRVDVRGGVAGMRDVETVEGNGAAGSCAAAPGDAGAVGAQLGNADEVVAVRIDIEKGLFAHDGNARDFGVRRRGPFAGGRIDVADKNHVPVGAGPTAPLAVARDPLLLRAGVHVAIDERVGHPAAAGPAAILVKDEVAFDVHAAEGRGLRDGPLHGAGSPPVGVTAKPSTPRQKVQVALLRGRLASAWTLPVM